MKLLKIIVKPFKLESVLKNLVLNENITISHVEEIKGYSKVNRKRVSFYKDNPLKIDYLPKNYISLLCEDDKVEDTIDELRKQLRSSEIGDGKVFLINLERVIDISSAN